MILTRARRETDYDRVAGGLDGIAQFQVQNEGSGILAENLPCKST